MKKPNGYGSVYKLKGNRRKPWTAVITEGFVLENDHSVQKRKTLGYYKTKKEANVALALYNSDPYEIGWTFENVYEKWKESKTIADASMKLYIVAFKRFKPIHGKMFAKLKTAELERVISECECTDHGKRYMKILLNQMYQYALRYDIVQHDLASRFSVKTPEKKIKRQAFTDEEIKTLWESDAQEAKFALIMCYTGLRINELLKMELDKDEWLLKGGSKTNAGKNRIVPVREKIRPLMDYEKVSYRELYHSVYVFLKKMGHTPHDCRVTFATRYKSCDVIAVKLIMGHEINDITKGVYTKYTPEELSSVIESVDF